MTVNLDFNISPQPTETTCGISCLQAVYAYYGEDVPVQRLMKEVEHLEEGGTLSVFLACHALKRGFRARIYTYNLRVFDPTWFGGGVDIAGRLKAQAARKHAKKLRIATKGYLEFLELGGELKFEDLTTALIQKHLERSTPIITGLSATYLYQSSREIAADGSDDDIGGAPAGHFVVLCGYDRDGKKVLVADPFRPNPYAGNTIYHVSKDRVVCSILLGVLTYDANLLVITPGNAMKGENGAGPNSRR
jgi:peptidase C39-like protein